MKRKRCRKCNHCKALFRADPRNRRHQKYCSEDACRHASKQARQSRWRKKPENRDYFRGPENVARVQEWRRRTPEYWKRRVKVKTNPLQDVLVAQDTETITESGVLMELALQDVLTNQPAVMIGIIAQLAGTTLQDDIAHSFQILLRLGHDILRGGRSNNGEKRAFVSDADPACAEAV